MNILILALCLSAHIPRFEPHNESYIEASAVFYLEDTLVQAFEPQLTSQAHQSNLGRVSNYTVDFPQGFKEARVKSSMKGHIR